jgi:hypothetical protein
VIFEPLNEVETEVVMDGIWVVVYFILLLTVCLEISHVSPTEKQHSPDGDGWDILVREEGERVWDPKRTTPRFIVQTINNVYGMRSGTDTNIYVRKGWSICKAFATTPTHPSQHPT